MINRAPVNTRPVNAAAVIVPPVVVGTGQIDILLRQYSVERSTISVLIEQESHYPRAALSIDLTQISFDQATISLALRQSSTEQPAGSGHAGAPASTLWRLIVLLNGIDISASLIGEWHVDAEVDAARVAEFSMIPAIGAIDPTAWVRKPVTMDYAVLNADNSIRYQQRLFTGIVDVPEYDPATRITLFRCTNQLQEMFEQTDTEGIDALGGYWSAHIFDADADGWQRARDRLSTMEASLELDGQGAVHVTDWAAKSSADYEYGDGGYLADSRRLELANSRDLHNRVRIRFDYRFQRLRQRDLQWNWQMSPQISCDYLQNPFELPRRAMIASAAEATGWAVQNISYVDLPAPTIFSCTPIGGGAPFPMVWGYKIVGPLVIPNPAAAEPFCQGAYIKLGKRWAQTITERYTIDIRAPQSIAQIGEIGREDQGSLEADQEIEGWETSLEYESPTTGATLHRNNDWVLDADQGAEDGRSAMADAVRTLQAIHRAAILNAHRRNYVAWDTLIQPQLELRHTLRLQSTAITAKGKLHQLVHRGDIDSGEALTELTLALSRSGTTGAAGDDPLDPPAVPDSQVEPVPDSTPGLFYGGAGMHIGGTTTVQGFDEDWIGLVTNYQWDPTQEYPFATDPDLPQTVVYPVQFRIEVPEIETAARQAVEAQQLQTINVDIPLDELVIN